jgi:hypothetical protein
MSLLRYTSRGGGRDEDGEQVGRDDVDRKDVRAPGDAGVVDDRVERA